MRKVVKELPNTGSEEMDLPLKELALITGAALLARRRSKKKKNHNKQKDLNITTLFSDSVILRSFLIE